MLQSLPEFLHSYWMYLAGGAVACAVMSYFSDKFFSYLKKGLLLFAIVFALAAAYELVTGNNIFTLPGQIDRGLEQEPAKTETGRRYYKSYEERYGDKAPQ